MVKTKSMFLTSAKELKTTSTLAVCAILPMRTVKNLIMWPVDSFIFFTVTRLIEQTGLFNLLRKPAAN